MNKDERGRLACHPHISFSVCNNRVFTLERPKVAEAFCVDLALLEVDRALS